MATPSSTDPTVAMGGTQRVSALLDRLREQLRAVVAVARSIDDVDGGAQVLQDTRAFDNYMELLDSLGQAEAAYARVKHLVDSRSAKILTTGAVVCYDGEAVARWSAIATAPVSVTTAPTFDELNDGVPDVVRRSKTMFSEPLLVKLFDRSCMCFVEDDGSRQGQHMGFTTSWFLWCWSTLLSDRDQRGDVSRALLVTTPARAQRLSATFQTIVGSARVVELADLFAMTQQGGPRPLDPNLPRFIIASPDHLASIDLRQVSYCAWDAPIPVERGGLDELPWQKLTALVVRGQRDAASRLKEIVKDPTVTSRVWITPRRLSVSTHADTAALLRAVQDALRSSSAEVTVFTQTPQTFFYGNVVAHSFTDALPPNLQDVIAVDPAPEYVAEWVQRVACQSLVIFTSREDVALKLRSVKESASNPASRAASLGPASRDGSAPFGGSYSSYLA